jgi:hypothetical protein
MSRKPNRREVLAAAVSAVTAAVLPIPQPDAASILAPAAPAPALVPKLRPRRRYEPPHPLGAWEWMNAIEEALWCSDEELARCCPCVICTSKWAKQEANANLILQDLAEAKRKGSAFRESLR